MYKKILFFIGSIICLCRRKHKSHKTYVDKYVVHVNYTGYCLRCNKELNKDTKDVIEILIKYLDNSSILNITNTYKSMLDDIQIHYKKLLKIKKLKNILDIND